MYSHCGLLLIVYVSCGVVFIAHCSLLVQAAGPVWLKLQGKREVKRCSPSYYYYLFYKLKSFAIKVKFLEYIQYLYSHVMTIRLMVSRNLCVYAPALLNVFISSMAGSNR